MGFDGPLTREDFKDLGTAITLLRELKANPAAFYAELGGRLGQPKAAEKTYDFPPASLRSADGQEAYTAQDVQKIAAMIEEKVLNTVQGNLKPIQEWRSSAEAAAADAQLDRDSRGLATDMLTEARTNLRHFKENEADIKSVMLAIQEQDPQILDRIGPIGVLYRAYNQVLHTKVFPGLDAASEQRVREENSRKAAGSSLVTPNGAGGVATSKVQLRDGDVSGLAKHLERLAEAGTAAL